MGEGKLPVTIVPSGEAGGKNVRLVTKRGAIILVSISLTIIALAAAKFPGAPWNNHGVAALGDKLLVAASKGDEDAVRDLLHSGAPADWRGKDGVSPLIIASSRAEAPIVKALLRSFAAVDARTADGFTALHAAAAARGGNPGQPEVVYSLLAAGADRTALTMDGRTPLDLASGGNSRIVDMLKRDPAIHGEAEWTMVDRQGNFRTFRSINVAALVDQRDRAAFRNVVRTASALVMDSKTTLADYIAFQPVESLHLTAVQLYNSNVSVPGSGNWTQFVSDHLGFFQKLAGMMQSNKYQPKVVFDANATLHRSAISGLVGTPVCLMVRDATDLARWTDTLPLVTTLDMRDREEIAAGLQRAKPFHITLGYFYRDATKFTDKIQKSLVEIVLGAHQRTKFEVLLQRPRLFASNDLTQYIPWSGATNPWVTRPRVTRIGPPKKDKDEEDYEAARDAALEDYDFSKTTSESSESSTSSSTDAEEDYEEEAEARERAEEEEYEEELEEEEQEEYEAEVEAEAEAEFAQEAERKKKAKDEEEREKEEEEEEEREEEYEREEEEAELEEEEEYERERAQEEAEEQAKSKPAAPAAKAAADAKAAATEEEDYEEEEAAERAREAEQEKAEKKKEKPSAAAAKKGGAPADADYDYDSSADYEGKKTGGKAAPAASAAPAKKGGIPSDYASSDYYEDYYVGFEMIEDYY